MKRIIFVLVILIFSNLQLFADDRTLQFSSTEISITKQKITYSILDNILLPNGLSLPYQNIYILPNNEPNFSPISTENIETELITTFEENSIAEIPTSSDPELYEGIVSSASFDKLGQNQIQYMGTETFNGTTYEKYMLFPITVDSDGKACLHTSSKIMRKNQILNSESFLTKSDIVTNKNTYSTSLHSLSTSTKYIIVTNQELSSSFEKLKLYKNQTGINTDIMLIENILASYSGRDNAEKLREYLKSFYTSGGEYVLLGGDETVIPIRYAYHNIAYDTISLENQQVTDLYFADLTGDWNADNDSVWGEKYTDSVDLTPELYVGRLPFNSQTEVENYISKLIQYETNTKDIDLSYLEKSFFFCSDQMRDYNTIGQHALIAEALPSYFTIDTTNGIERASGNDPNPTNKPSIELEPVLSSGFGIVNIIAHGSSMTFEVRTTNYNEWPKSYFTTDTALIHTTGVVSNLDKNDMTSLYLSLGCDNGAFDKDQEPFNHQNPNLVQTLLAQEQSGAVAFIANTRWGWVSTSYLLQKRYLEYLFENKNLPAIEALYQMKDDFYYYRDLIYGINYFGDPTLKIHLQKPNRVELEVQYFQSKVVVMTRSNNIALANCKIFVSDSSGVLAEYETDNNGQVEVDMYFDLNNTYYFSAVKDNYTIAIKDFSPSIATDIEDDKLILPSSFSLKQNFPNPFNPNTSISFSLPIKSNISLIIYNSLGQEVKRLVDNIYNAGEYTVEWDGTDNSGNQTATGIYLYRIESENFKETKKMVLLK